MQHNLCTLPALATLLLGTLLASAAQAQSQTAAAEPAFATASIRSVHLVNGCYSMLPPGGEQFAATCITVRNLIQMAYKTDYIDGGGSALDSFYDLRATMPDGQPWSMTSIQPMLRQLLRDRFHLQVRAGKREIPGFSLTVAKNGAKLQAVTAETAVQGQKAGEPSQNFFFPGHIQGRGLGPNGICSLLSVAERAPVVDRTGLKGIYNVDLSYAPDTEPNPTLPTLPTALEEQLGLKLKPEKVTVETLVIDHVDSEPTPN